jgi:hypothetical protein
MGLSYKNLDELTRRCMLEELEMDIGSDSVYLGKRMNPEKQKLWIELLKKSLAEFDDNWLANQLKTQSCLKTQEDRKLSSGKIIKVKVPETAYITLAEGEFNRYYARGVCLRAIKEGIGNVLVYRGKEVTNPRQESEAKIGNIVVANVLLDDLRKSIGVETALGIPSGPNSGLTIRLP